MTKTSEDPYGGIRIPKTLLRTAREELKKNAELKAKGFNTVGRWATYLLQRELDRYCKNSAEKS